MLTSSYIIAISFDSSSSEPANALYCDCSRVDISTEGQKREQFTPPVGMNLSILVRLIEVKPIGNGLYLALNASRLAC